MAGRLTLLGCSKSMEDVNRDIATNLPSLYTIQRKSIFAGPNIPHWEVNEITRDAHLNDKVENDMTSKATTVNRVVDPHAVYAGGVQPAGRGGVG